MSSTIITYNSYTLPLLVSKFRLKEDYKNLTFSCEFLVTGATEAAFVAACNAAETALSVWNKDFRLVLGSTTEYSYSHSANTGFLAQPSLSIVPNKTHTGRSRTYSFSVVCQLPARDSGYNYRQSANIGMQQDSRGRKLLSVSGVYTAGGSKSAEENYEDYGVSWAEGIASGYGSYEEIHRDHRHEQEDKILHFSFSFREKLTLAVEYNGYSIPGAYNNFTFQENYNSLTMSFDFAIATGASATAAEVALRQKNKDLTVSFGGTAAYSYKHSDNTGFLASPTLRKVSNKTENDALRFYTFSVVCQLPADAAGYGYRRDAKISVKYAVSRQRTVTISGIYTAGGANTALANYQANATTWAASWLTAIGGVYELVAESVSPEMENKLCPFVFSYQEILANQSKANTDEAGVVSADCSYSTSLQNLIGISSNYVQTPLLTVSLQYSAYISREVVSSDSGLEAVYIDTVRPWLMEHSFSVLGIDTFGALENQYVILAENYQINPYTYRVAGSITFWALSSVTQIIELSESNTTSVDEGVSLQKLYDGQKYTYNRWFVGEEFRRTRNIRIKKIGTPPGPPAQIGGKWQLLNSTLAESVQKMGVGSGNVGGYNKEFWVFDYVFSENYVYIDEGSTTTNLGLIYTDPSTAGE